MVLLKKGYSNYQSYLTRACYVGSGETVDKYPMVIESIPFLINRPGEGHNVDIVMEKKQQWKIYNLSLIQISEPTRP